MARRRAWAIASLILALTAANGLAYSHWQDEARITATVRMTRWKALLRIRKTLEGAYTDPETGGILEEPTGLIAVAANHTTRFRLTICVKNEGSTPLAGVVVTDTVKTNAAPREWHPTRGTVTWESRAPGHRPWDGVHLAFSDLTWTIGALDPDEEAFLVIWIETLRNPQDRYEPTSGDEDDGQELEINGGAAASARSPYARLTASTGPITIEVEDDGTPGNGVARVATQLPLSTPWAEGRYP